MKKALLTVLTTICMVVTSLGQSFSGTITYKMEMKNLPEGMPQATLDQMFPSKMMVHIKGNKVATTTNAGVMQKLVMDADKDTTYLIVDQSKTIYAMTQKDIDDQKKGKKDPNTIVKKTTSTATIAGYKCTQYDVTVESEGQTINQKIWATTDIKAAKPKVNAEQMFYSDIEGVMMRMTSKVMGIDMNVEVTNVSTTPPDGKVFELPADYERRQFSPTAMMEIIKANMPSR